MNFLSVPVYSNVMRPYIIMSLLLLLAGRTLAQSNPERFESATRKYNAQLATDFIRISYDKKTIQALDAQCLAWAKVVQEESKDASYWLNYYMVSRFKFQQTNGGSINAGGHKTLAKIAGSMDTAIGQPLVASFEKSLVHYFEETDYTKATTHLFNAYKVNPNHTFFFPELAKYYEYKGDISNRNLFAGRIKEVGSNTAIYQFSRGLLRTLPDSAVIITGGDYDTYALWNAIANAGGNYTIISLKQLETPGYLETVAAKYKLKIPSTGLGKEAFLKQLLAGNPSRKLYVSLTVAPALINEIKDKLYSNGLCYQYSETRLNNIAGLYYNLVTTDVFGSIPGYNNDVLKNVMPGYITLYRMYQDEGSKEMIKKRAQAFATTAGFWKEYEKYFK